MITVLIADDHDLVRAGIAAMLNMIEDISVVKVVGSGEEAVEALETLHVDIVLMDVIMPGIGGVEACRRILQQDPETKIIAVSVYNDGPIPHQLLKIGVLGFVSKSSSMVEMVDAIRSVMDGKRYLCAKVANNLAFQGLPGSNGSPFSMLSNREAEVVNLILQGMNIKEMAEVLAISDKTINTYRYRIYSKLRVKNDVELVRLAVKFEYIDKALI